MRGYEIPIIYAKYCAGTTLEKAQSFQMRISGRNCVVVEVTQSKEAPLTLKAC